MFKLAAFVITLIVSLFGVYVAYFAYSVSRPFGAVLAVIIVCLNINAWNKWDDLS
jgi:hypothetical protein